MADALSTHPERSEHLDIEQHILRLETQLLTSDTRRDTAQLTALLAEDFAEFGASGKAWTREEVIAGLLQETQVARAISRFAVRLMAEGVVLATYVCSHRAADGCESRSLRSSIWRDGPNGWQMAFHQGTRFSVGCCAGVVSDD